MDIENNNFINTCISCNGVGKINCDCGSDNIPNKKCVTCQGIGNFKCPICDGEGKL